MSEAYIKFAMTMKIIVGSVSLIVIVLLVYLYMKIFQMLKKEKYKIMNPPTVPKTGEEVEQAYRDDWEQIKQFANSLQESEWKLAIIQADKLVDEVLRAAGYQGESMGERMMSINPKSFISLQDLWEAHKLRNIVVHDMKRSVGKGQVSRAIESYEKFLKEIGFFTS